MLTFANSLTNISPARAPSKWCKGQTPASAPCTRAPRERPFSLWPEFRSIWHCNNLPMIAARAAGRYDRSRSCLDGPQQNPVCRRCLQQRSPSVHVDVLCSLCGEADFLVLNLSQPGNLSWLWRHDFYFVCGRHRQLAGN